MIERVEGSTRIKEEVTVQIKRKGRGKDKRRKKMQGMKNYDKEKRRRQGKMSWIKIGKYGDG